MDLTICPHCTKRLDRFSVNDFCNGNIVRCGHCLKYTQLCVLCKNVTVEHVLRSAALFPSGYRACRPCRETVTTPCAGPDCSRYLSDKSPFSHDHGLPHEGKRYCVDCHARLTSQCRGCKKRGFDVKLTAHSSRTADGAEDVIFICAPCTSQAKACAYCGNRDLPAYMTRSPGTRQLVHETEPVHNYICTTYCMKGHSFCSDCGFNIVNVAPGEGGLCQACKSIVSYHEKVELRVGFLGGPPCHAKCAPDHRANAKGVSGRRAGCDFDGFYFGVELEVMGETPLFVEDPFGDAPRIAPATEALAKRTRELLDRKVLCKRDGSIPGGFEIVSAPATFDYVQKLWAPFWEWVQGGWRSDKLKLSERTNLSDLHRFPLLAHNDPQGRCGLHVHVSRAPMSWLQIGKIVPFIHAPENREFVEFMAGRPPGHYQDYLRDKRIYKGPPSGVKTETYSPTRDHSSRYTAVNLQNRATIEFRIFKATLNPATFWARLEFVKALVYYTRTAEASLRHMTVPHFTEWLDTRERRKEYKHLVEHLGKGAFIALPGESATPIFRAAVPVTGARRKHLRLKKGNR